MKRVKQILVRLLHQCPARFCPFEHYASTLPTHTAKKLRKFRQIFTLPYDMFKDQLSVGMFDLISNLILQSCSPAESRTWISSNKSDPGIKASSSLRVTWKVGSLITKLLKVDPLSAQSTRSQLAIGFDSLPLVDLPLVQLDYVPLHLNPFRHPPQKSP